MQVSDQDRELVSEEWSTASGYANNRLGMTLHPVQAAVLDDVFPPPSKKKSSRVAFRCGNETGKTSRVTCATILFALEILDAQVISTAGVWMQVVQQLVPYLKKFSPLFPGWSFNESTIRIAGVDRYVGFSTRDEGFAQGFHRDAGRPLVAIIDEAAAVKDIIFDGIEDRCNPDYLLITGSPLDPVGRFYDIETRLAKYYVHHHLGQMQCLTRDGWWIDYESIERKIAKHGGEAHPFIQSNVFGEFSERVANALLSLREFNSCLENAIVNPESTERHAFIDVAGGVAKNVFAVRRGNRCWIEKKWTEPSEMAACGEIVAIFKKLEREIGLRSDEVDIDASGAGKVMADRLREMGFDFFRFMGQTPPRFDPEYSNAISEVWGYGASRIKSRDNVIPNDDDFRSQVLTRTLKRNSTGKFQIEHKDDYCRRGYTSPDEADALLGTMTPSHSTHNAAGSTLPKRGSWEWHTWGQKSRSTGDKTAGWA